MPTNDELRAVAETLLREFTSHMVFLSSGTARRVCMIAKAYLAHLDAEARAKEEGEQLADEAWLREILSSLGWEPFGEALMCSYSQGNMMVKWIHGDFANTVAWSLRSERTEAEYGHGGIVDLPTPTTRRQVRLLIEALSPRTEFYEHWNRERSDLSQLREFAQSAWWFCEEYVQEVAADDCQDAEVRELAQVVCDLAGAIGLDHANPS